MNYDKLREELRRDEGENLSLYKCPAKKWTIGVGHNLEDNGISKQVSTMLLNEDIEVAIAACVHIFPNWEELDDDRQNVLINMAFNLGLNRLSKFKLMIEAVKHLDFQAAAAEMLNSKWARQVKQRAQRLANRMRGGQDI